MHQPNYKKIITGSLSFLALAVITWFFISHEYSRQELLSAWNQANPLFLLPAALFMVIFILCEGANIGRGLSLFGYDITFIQKTKYALTGFFFSSITPSASGGQPMQVYAMYKDGISPSHASLSLVIELAGFQVISTLAAVLGLCLEYSKTLQSAGPAIYLFFIGIAVNFALLLLLLAAIFSKSVLKKLIDIVLWIVNKLFPKKYENWKKKILRYGAEYSKSAMYFKQSPKVMLQILGTAAVQLLSFYSIPYFVYLSLGLHGITWLHITAIQAILYVSVSALPLPGAVGVTEGGFALLFQNVLPPAFMGCAMILSRLISFYFAVVLSGIAVLWSGTFKKNSIRINRNKAM